MVQWPRFSRMGWALKTAKKKTMFSQEQKKYLTEQFVIGEESGKKADPKQVSQDMQKVRSELGVRKFPDTVEQTWLLQRSFMKFQQNNSRF